jgi:hypothetical protein
MYTENAIAKKGSRFGKKFGCKMLICFLLLAIVTAFNIVNSSSGANEKNLLQQTEMKNSVGIVKGILSNENYSTVLIGTELFHNGDVISGAKIIKIHSGRVDFAKDGISWTQHVMEKSE